MTDDLIEDIYIIDDPNAWDRHIHGSNFTVLDIPSEQSLLAIATKRYIEWLLDKHKREAQDGNTTGQQEP